MLGTGKILSSQFGAADCQLLPCPGWDCGALFPSATLRLDGSWYLAAPSQRPVVPHFMFCRARADGRLCASCPAPCAPTRPPCARCLIWGLPAAVSLFRVAGDATQAPVLLIAHLLAGGAFVGNAGPPTALRCRSNAQPQTQHPAPFKLPRFVLTDAGPCFFIRCHTSRGQHLPRS